MRIPIAWAVALVAALALLVWLDADIRRKVDRAAADAAGYREEAMEHRKENAAQWVEIAVGGVTMIVRARPDETAEALWDRIDSPPPVAKVTCWASGDVQYEVHTIPQPGETTEECEARHEEAVEEGQSRHPKTGDCPS